MDGFTSTNSKRLIALKPDILEAPTAERNMIARVRPLFAATVVVFVGTLYASLWMPRYSAEDGYHIPPDSPTFVRDRQGL